MDYQRFVEYLEQTSWFGINPGLERIAALSEELGMPHEKYPLIQVTGTNGKTSTTWLIGQILESEGVRVGTYTSPHVTSYTERINVGGQRIEREQLAEFLAKMLPYIEKVRSIDLGEVTHFEVLTALAFLFFERQRVDAAVVEVGMGGRWDATSIADAKIGVITNVSLDHTERLGGTTDAIAREKVEIIKGGADIVCGRVDSAVDKIVADKALEMGAHLYRWGHDICLEEVAGPAGPAFRVNGVYGTYQNLRNHDLPSYIAENTALAIAAAELFLKHPLNPDGVASVFAQLTLPGRAELIRKRPWIMLDGAHNPAGVARLVADIKETYDFSRLTLVLAVLEDKDVSGILDAVLPVSDKVMITENRFYRSMPAATLAAEALKGRPDADVEVFPDLREALEVSLSIIAEDDFLLVTGSLYTVGEARKIMVDGDVQ